MNSLLLGVIWVASIVHFSVCTDCSSSSSPACDSLGTSSVDVLLSQRSGVVQSQSLTASTSSPEYIGCYRDTEDRDLKFGPFYDHVPSCARACSGYSYFSLQYNGQCFCDNSYSTPPDVFARIADSACGGAEPSVGGSWANAVYRVPGDGESGGG